jgi:hypothetical protein
MNIEFQIGDHVAVKDPFPLVGEIVLIGAGRSPYMVRVVIDFDSPRYFDYSAKELEKVKPE